MSTTTKVLIGAGVAVGVYLVWKAWSDSKAMDTAANLQAMQQARADYSSGGAQIASNAASVVYTDSRATPATMPAMGSMGAH